MDNIIKISVQQILFYNKSRAQNKYKHNKAFHTATNESIIFFFKEETSKINV